MKNYFVVILYERQCSLEKTSIIWHIKNLEVEFPVSLEMSRDFY